MIFFCDFTFVLTLSLVCVSVATRTSGVGGRFSFNCFSFLIKWFSCMCWKCPPLVYLQPVADTSRNIGGRNCQHVCLRCPFKICKSFKYNAWYINDYYMINVM